MDVEETITVDATRVKCDGGGGALGHPAVFLEMGKKTEVTCPYCSRHFVLDESKAKAAGSGH